jgi:hypothetical protein
VASDRRAVPDQRQVVALRSVRDAAGIRQLSPSLWIVIGPKNRRVELEMKMKPLLLALTLTTTAAVAHEGMWTPQQLPQIAGDLKATGLALDPAQLTDLTAFPMGAIISLGNCTASFVSPEGLVVTNHHCAYGSIQFNSMAEKNLIEQGFLAQAQADELRAAPGSRVYVTVDVRKVTDRILDKRTSALTGKALIDAMEANEKNVVAECEKDVGHRCNVYGFYGGLEFHLIKHRQLDVAASHR